MNNYVRPPEPQKFGDPPQYTVPHQLCDFCNVSYPEDTFIKHLIVEHSELLFHCEQCDKYLNRRQFIAHMSLHAVQYTDRSELVNNMGGENDGTQNNNTIAPAPNHDADKGAETRNCQSLTNTEHVMSTRDSSTIISITSNQNVNITPTLSPQNISVAAPKTNYNSDAKETVTRTKISKTSVKRNKSQQKTTVTTTSNTETKGTTAVAENNNMNDTQATNTHHNVADPTIPLRHNQTANNALAIRNQNTNTQAPVTRSQNITPATAKPDTTSLPQSNKTTKHSQENEFSDHSDMEYGFGPLPESVFEAIEDTQDSQQAEDTSQVVDIEYPDDDSNSATKDCNIKVPASKKPRTCPICSKVYKASSSYFYHLRHTHKKIKEHECEICANKFATRAILASHITTHTGVYQFECNHCKKRFRSKASLYIHEQTHIGIKTFSCEQCDTSFRWRTQLLRHMKRHSAEKSHVCAICGRGFSIRCDLLRHTRTHTAGDFSCEECDVKFAQMRYLKEHMNKKHSKTVVKK
ncbi:unnamed protein product [Arctia plantaginis]|uniref:C2H2-type domain-containing protein n=1 Tax=Arctia plantaginis TaxID=874455 RepID=A0A8S1ANR6_ARCPL|nr:unnamed protein product [Arctia plantaginis]